MDIQKVIDYWIEGAQQDMEAAEQLLQGKFYPQCLFWCHLVLEKLLKAYVVKQTGTQAPYLHNLLSLAGKTGLELSHEQRTWLAEMNDFNITGRYPEEMTDIIQKCTPEVAQKYFFITKNLYQWLIKKISSP